MALNECACWIIAYDIRCPKRLNRVHKFLVGEAIWVQYSIFVTNTTAQKIGCLRSELLELIDDDADDIRIYRVPDRPMIVTLGNQGFPAGVMLLENINGGHTIPFTYHRQANKVMESD